MNACFTRQLFLPWMLVAFLMGFSCGVPIPSTSSVLEAWMDESGVGISVNGWLALYCLGRRA